MKGRGVFLSVFLGLVCLAYAYLGWRLARNAGGWFTLALPFLSVLYFLRRVVSRRAHAGDWIFLQLAYLSMGLVSFLLVAALARDLLGIFTGRWISAPYVWAAAASVLLLASLRGIWGPSVKQKELAYADLPAELDGIRLAQISDLHISQSLRAPYIARVVRKTAALRPDLIFFTGDIGDGPVAQLREDIEALAPITELAPVFYVPGNHEVYWNLAEWLDEFRRMGMRVLLNEGENLGRLPVFVAGITDPAMGREGPNLNKAGEKKEGARFSILLSHRPDSAEEAAAKGYDLQLSGHTHGGQFFPWTIVASLVHRYSLGAYRLGRMWVYVSAGTGSWGPRLRLGTTAEITLLTLRSGV